MQITEVLSQMGGISSMASQLGISEQEAARGTDALAPAVLGGFKKQAQSQPGGLDGLGGLLGQLGGGNLLDDALKSQPAHVDRGNDVLGQIFGSKDVSRTVAQNASSRSGLDPALLKKMLPILAMMVAGYMAKQRGAAAQGSPRSGGLASLLSGVFGRGGRSAGAGAGVAGLASLLDMNKDGNPLDDILRMVGQGKR